jgi:Thioesterase-like superfamily
VSDPTSLFVPVDDGSWLPTAFARGPWSPDALHGGPVAALLAGALEAAGGNDPPMHAARLTVELLRPVPLAPLHVRAAVSRPGRKVQLVDGEITTASDGAVVATARLLRIRDKDLPTAPVTTGGLDAPPPPERLPRTVPNLGEFPGFASHGVEHRFVSGMIRVPGPATDWIRLTVPVVPGLEPTPLQRVAAAADFGNGISGVTDFATHLFINPDVTIYLHRAAEGEFVCLEAVTWMEDRGVALAESRLWDEHGPIGRSLQSLLVDDRAPGGAP